MSKVTFRKVIVDGGPVLAPVDDDAREALGNFNQADDISVSLIKIRSPKFHRKYFALIRFGHDNTDNFNGSEYAFRKACTVLAGHYTPVQMPDDTVHLEADSIAFENMDETQFSKLYQATIDVILEHYLPDMEPEELDRIIREIIGFS